MSIPDVQESACALSCPIALPKFLSLPACLYHKCHCCGHAVLGLGMSRLLVSRSDVSITPSLPQTEGTSVHWYGKEPQLKRKLGHITIVAPDNATARQRLKTIDPAAADAMEAASSTPTVSQGTQGIHTVLRGTYTVLQGTDTILQGTQGTSHSLTRYLHSLTRPQLTCAAKTLLTSSQSANA